MVLSRSIVLPFAAVILFVVGAVVTKRGRGLGLGASSFHTSHGFLFPRNDASGAVDASEGRTRLFHSPKNTEHFGAEKGKSGSPLNTREQPLDLDLSDEGRKADLLDIAAEAPDLGVECWNEYSSVSPVTTLYGFELMAEPYRPSTCVVDSPLDGATYVWFIDGVEHSTGAAVDLLLTSTGSHTIEVHEVAADTLTSADLVASELASVPIDETNGFPSFVTGSTLRTFSGDIMVKYVRREIRSLKDADREAFFNAFMVLQTVPTTAGVALYGSDYKSKDFFTRLHLYYGGGQDCDHWHQGAGFVTSHMALTMEMEKALQAVDPSVTVPYWDFTLESTFYTADEFRASPVFADDWFGDAAPDNDLHTVTEGRFAYTPVMTNAWNFSALTNSYGLLRSPWNNDPTPFMTRSDHVYGYFNNLKPSGCTNYFEAMNKDNWMDLAQQLNSAAHGHIHELMGGSWNTETRRDLVDQRMNEEIADEADAELEEEDPVSPAALTFAHEIQQLSKELWRTDFLQCPDYCSMDTDWEDCRCECSAETLDMSPYDVLDQAGVLKAVDFFDAAGHQISSFYGDDGELTYNIPGYSQVESDHIIDDLLSLLCTPGHIGDMFQATSTNDITFWVLHPTVDRLWHYMRVEAENPTYEEFTYDDTWEDVNPCYGHKFADIQPFRNLWDDDDVYYTNQMIYDNMDPTSEGMPYMYDNFDWTHCDMLGFDMTPGSKKHNGLVTSAEDPLGLSGGDAPPPEEDPLAQGAVAEEGVVAVEQEDKVEEEVSSR